MHNFKYYVFLFLSLLGVTFANVALQFPERVVSIGDVHGDLASFVSILLEAKIIEVATVDELVQQEKECPVLAECATNPQEEMPEWRIRQEKRVEPYRWIAGKTVLIQTGDMLDRGMDTIAVYALLRKLQKQAEKAGGAVIPLLGNHEAMNICGYWQDVIWKEKMTFGTTENAIHNRKMAFSKTGFLGKEIRNRDSVLVVGGTVYSHAGLSGDFAKKDLAQLNEEIRNALHFKNVGEKIKHCGTLDSVLRHDDGPHWSRNYAISSMSGEEKEAACKTLDAALADLKADRMVIGHNHQESGYIGEFCDGKLFLIDVAMSKGMGNNPGAALEMHHTYEGEADEKVLKGTEVNIIYAKSKILTCTGIFGLFLDLLEFFCGDVHDSLDRCFQFIRCRR